MRKNNLLILFNSQTIGWVKAAKAFIGLATILAMRSALNNPICFGISSPKMMERKVTIITMMVVAIVLAYSFRKPIFSIDGCNRRANLSPEYTPVRIAISVMPICAADKNFSGLLESSNAFFALSSPFSAWCSNLDLRAETNAISDITNNPFTKIRARSIIISI